MPPLASLPQTNVPDIRLAYRHQTLLEELAMVRGKPADAHKAPVISLPTADAIALKNEVFH
jgi:hypothetical protein